MQPTIAKRTLKAAVTERRFAVIKWIKSRFLGAKRGNNFLCYDVYLCIAYNSK